MWPAHEALDASPDVGFTIRYLAEPKSGLLIHFFSRQEIQALSVGWEEQLPLRLDVTVRPALRRAKVTMGSDLAEGGPPRP